ncbi:hypothetical protein [Rhizobium sp. L43]|uniref:hypothetical protein n=1 Tax=Rhizobium sp. L43 TaxID=2035452 RepID=UPI000BE97322|nr:hypothetical protein [Rhizobium sp. L43]PDS79161.1 hypothetical protein CO667_10110 [Rhizobium sp. L43]
MIDRREQILARLVAVGAAVEGVEEWFVVTKEWFVATDDELVAGSDLISTTPGVVTMTPKAYAVVANWADVNQVRAGVINAIETDAQLKALTKDGQGGQFQDVPSERSGGHSIFGDHLGGLAFSFHFVLKPAPPVLTLIQGGLINGT